MTGGTVRLTTANARLLPGNYARPGGGCADVTEKKPADPNSLQGQARKLQETLQRLLKENNELLDRTRGKDRSAPEGGRDE